MNAAPAPMFVLTACTVAAMCTAAPAADPPPESPLRRLRLSLTEKGAHHVEVTELRGETWEIRTTGADPYVFTRRIDPPADATVMRVLEFEYFCPSGLDSFQVYFGPRLSEKRSVKGDGPAVAEGWSRYALDLAVSSEWKGRIPFLRLDFGRRPGRTLRIRNIVLRAPTAEERERAARREERRAAERRLDAALARYLATDYPCRVDRVAVTSREVRVTFSLRDEPPSDVLLCEVPVWQNVTDLQTPLYSTLVRSSHGTLALPRFAESEGLPRDRLLSRWVLARRTNGTLRLLSHARYADDDAVEAVRSLPEARIRSRKGLGGFNPARCNKGSDADELGIGCVTVNILLSFMRPGPGPDVIPFEYCGRTYYAHRRTIESYDRTMRFCAERGIVVSAIILVPKAHGFGGDLGRYFAHPDCTPEGIYAMPNLTSPEAVHHYAAALSFLAERYSREDGKYGRIHNWIMHNEVDAGWVWTNAGPKPLRCYLDLYHKSMRTAHLIARQYDPNARAFISLTHHWTWTSDKHFYLPREMLELLAQWSRLEGDFDWGIAYHPYPQSLRNPRSWEDDKVSFSFDTPLITFKNIEVLAAWVERPDMKYKTRFRRRVHLSEQGANSPDYSEKSLRDQAACVAYAWKKIEPLEAIEGFEYHNWMDHPGEGGLRLGLRKFPGPPYNCEPKPAWFVYKALGTPDEDAACRFALDVIGIRDWDEIRWKGPIR